MNLYKDLIPYIQPEIPGALPAVISQAIKKAARNFCRHTEAWRSTHLIDSDKEQLVYNFYLNDYSAILLRVVSVRVNGGEPLESYEYEVLDGNLSIKLNSYPPDSMQDGIEIVVAMLPEFTAVELSYPFFDQWSEAIIAGAKAELFKQPKKPYTNGELLVFSKREYNGLVNSCKAEKQRQHKSGTDRINFQKAGENW